MKCNSCLKEKEIYVNQICKECSDKMDNHIQKWCLNDIEKRTYLPMELYNQRRQIK